MSRRRFPVRELAISVAAIAVLSLAAFALQRLLFSRNASSANLTENIDQRLGAVVREQIRATRLLVDEPVVNRDFAEISRRLRIVLPGKGMSLDVLVVDSVDINAFTLPGGTVCVNTGLIRAMRSADEMAAVLGHEMSHVANRDSLNLLVRQIGMAALASALPGGQGGNVLSEIMQTVVNVHYGREAEDRADDFSVKLLARAGIPPDSFAKALERLKESGLKDPGLLKYLDPHSPIERRISRSEDLARRQSYSRRPLAVDWEALVKALPSR